MGKLSRLGLAGGALPIGSGLAAFFLLASMGPVGAADIIAPPEEPLAYTYFSVEGGYIHLDGEEVQAYLSSSEPTDEVLRERFFDISDGYYGRAELGRVWDTGPINGIGIYVQGWEADDEDLSENEFGMSLRYVHGDSNFSGTNICIDDGRPCARGEADLDRSLLEVGLRFIHANGDALSLDGVSLGIEPFVAFIKEDTSSTTGSTFEGPFEPNATRSSDLDAMAYGALLALDGRHHVLERTVLIGRVAAGAYYMDADADTSFAFFGFDSSTDDGLSSDFFGFRGQLALGIEQMLTEMFSIGVIGRLDYWSDYPSIEWTDWTSGPPENVSENSIADEDFLALSIGARITVNFR